MSERIPVRKETLEIWLNYAEMIEDYSLRGSSVSIFHIVQTLKKELRHVLEKGDE